MKKKNLFLLILACMLSLCVFTGLMVYAFQLQADKEPSPIAGEDSVLIEEASETEEATVSPSQSPIASTAPASSDNTDTSTASSASENPDMTVTPIPSENADMSDSSSEGTEEEAPTPTAQTQGAAVTDLTTIKHSNTEPIVLGFAGDVNLDESYYPVAKYDAEAQDINGCFSKDLLTEMNSADLMMLNNEFAYSTRGTKAPDKSFTFRADPSRVEILQKMGVDIVSLANNHALDYGPDALMDTFDTLDEAGINYVGAGSNLDRAKSPVYYRVGDKTIAYVAASRVVFAMDWYATEDGPGMVGTYDPTIILSSIREAKANSDYVVVFVHWGVEREKYPVDYQRTLATQYIDAGADAVIGCHPHIMQGLEFYKGKPIAYSLGNYWFNQTEQKSGMLKLYLEPDDSVKVQLLPAMNKDTYTYLLTKKAEKANYYDYIKGLSYDVSFDADGFITPSGQ